MLLNQPQMPQPLDPAKENALALQMQLLQAFPDQDHNAHIQAHSIFMQTRMVQINPQVYALMQAHISEHVSFQASLEVMEMVQSDPRMQATGPEEAQAMQIEVNKMIAKRIVELTSQLQQAEAQVAGQQQDPLIRLKQQEIDLRAMDLQRKAQEAQMKEQGQFTRQEADLALDLEKIKSQEDAQQDRLQLAKEKLKLQAQKQNQPRGN